MRGQRIGSIKLTSRKVDRFGTTFGKPSSHLRNRTWLGFSMFMRIQSSMGWSPTHASIHIVLRGGLRRLPHRLKFERFGHSEQIPSRFTTITKRAPTGRAFQSILISMRSGRCLFRTARACPVKLRVIQSGAPPRRTPKLTLTPVRTRTSDLIEAGRRRCACREIVTGRTGAGRGCRADYFLPTS